MARDGSNVPLYLRRVKSAIATEEQLIAQKMGLGDRSDGAPPGCMLLPESERLDTLERLKKRQHELEGLHRRLPLKIETLGQKQRCEELVKELKTVEDGIRNFSQPKVFVRVS